MAAVKGNTGATPQAWPGSPEVAACLGGRGPRFREQARLKALMVDRDTEAWQRDPTFSGLQRVGGVDVSFVNGDSDRACASLVVLSYPELKVVYEDSHMVRLKAPYVSGFLAFREVPFLVELVQRLQEKEPGFMPQVLLVDGNGVLHQRGFGVACHLGVLTDLPCIGVAKKLLQVDGLENNSLHKEKIVLLQAGGDTFPLMGNSGTVLGMALKSHDHSTNPLYVSVGHRISLEVAVRLTHHCCRFRIPEPIRQHVWTGPVGAALSQRLSQRPSTATLRRLVLVPRSPIRTDPRAWLCQADIRSRDYIRRTLGHPGSPAQRQERSQKEQRPKICPKDGPGAPAHQGRPPEDHGRDSITDLKDPQPGFQEQQKDQQLERTEHHEDSDL
ncbi:endonuclease V isoform X2 [Peromyscus californicus insignis]|uniref:endonuclease V isoform X2 n=1 Tax=Peromyscus californicus insignis TaxID=564181 RepID=UPI0022A765DD|nr:endonuclease V isoform X2 [Peromyscus californicus insignis]